MSKDEILIVKAKISISQKRLDDIRRSLTFQKVTGVVAIPDFLDVIVAPKDCEIVLEENDSREVEVFSDNKSVLKSETTKEETIEELLKRTGAFISDSALNQCRYIRTTLEPLTDSEKTKLIKMNEAQGIRNVIFEHFERSKQE